MAKIESVEINGRIYTKQSIKDKLVANDQWLFRGICAIYNENQTAAEKTQGGTIEDNGIGFSGADGALLSSFARQLNHHGALSHKQIQIARHVMPKYAGQLLAMAREKASKAQ